MTSLKLVLPSLKSLRAYSSLFGERTSYTSDSFPLAMSFPRAIA